MVSQLKDLTSAGFNEDTRVLVYFDPNCNGKPARIFNVNDRRKQQSNEEGEPTVIGDGADPYVRNIFEDCHVLGLEEKEAATSLRYFLEYSRYYYPARNYMLVLMGHGVIVGNDSFLPDTDDDSAITLRQLDWILHRFAKKVRAEKGEFQLVGLHSCSMNSVELAYQLAGSARYLIGTQGMAFPGSWPYRQVLKKVFNTLRRNKGKKERGGSNAPTLVQKILTGIQDLTFYNSLDFGVAGFSADLSLCSLDKDKVNRLTVPLRRLTRALKKGLSTPETKEAILLAHWESQSYWGENYTDLYDFCDRLAKYCDQPTGPQILIKEACKTIVEVLTSQRRRGLSSLVGNFDRLVVYSDYFGPAYQFSHGLSIYFPWTRPTRKVIERYEQYAFTQKNQSESWLSFLEEYFQKTERDLRGFKPGKDKVAGMGPPPNKVPGMGPPPDKLPGMGPRSDRKLLSLGPPPDKAPGLGPPPNKVPGLGPPPNKVPGMGPPPDKVPGMGPPPDKIPGMGLFGLTMVKNFAAPEHVFITSRPKRINGNGRGGKAANGPSKKRLKASKTR
jgi:hypothetical protein